MVPLSIIDLWSSQYRTRESKRGARHDRGLGGNEVSVVQGDLTEVGSHMLNLSVVSLLGNDQLSKEVDGRVSDSPLKSVENVHLHLSEHSRVVQSTAHVVQFVDLGHAILLVTVLGSNKEGRTSY